MDPIMWMFLIFMLIYITSIIVPIIFFDQLDRSEHRAAARQNSIYICAQHTDKLGILGLGLGTPGIYQNYVTWAVIVTVNLYYVSLLLFAFKSDYMILPLHTHLTCSYYCDVPRFLLRFYFCCCKYDRNFTLT